MIFKHYISHSNNPYYNLAMERFLFNYANDNTTIIYLWQNDNTIVVGRNQDLYSECLVDDFVKDYGKIARRMSGGGAVYHDLGNLNFSIISISSFSRDLYKKLVIDTLTNMDIDAIYNGRNDILVKGKKISGNAFYNDGSKTCQHGTILVDTNKDMLKKYLTPSKEKLTRNSVKSVEARIINLKEITPNISISTIKKEIIKTFNSKPLREKIDSRVIKKLKKSFSSKEWIEGGLWK